MSSVALILNVCVVAIVGVSCFKCQGMTVLDAWRMPQ